MTKDSTLYEVTVAFVIEQPDDLELSEAEVEDNVRMAIADLGTIGFARILPSSIHASVSDDVDPADWPNDQRSERE